MKVAVTIQRVEIREHTFEVEAKDMDRVQGSAASKGFDWTKEEPRGDERTVFVGHA